MNIKTSRAVALLTAASMAVLPLQSVAAQNAYQGTNQVHYGKTEVEKASHKCVMTVGGGALLGAGLGALIGGGKGAAIGAIGGGAAGATICAVLLSNAKHKDQIIRAQLAAAASPDGTYRATWTDDKGKPVAFTAQAGASQQVDAARLIPVRYEGANGAQMTSAIPTGGRDCREVSGDFANTKGRAPTQLVCRTPEGAYEPYEMSKAA
jgi:hypothetical protein